MAEGGIRATSRGRKRSAGEPSPTTPDPIEIAMEAEQKDTSALSPARTLLLKQGQLIEDQGRLIAAQLHDLRLEAFNKRVRMAFDLALAIGVISLLIAAGALAWNASRARGLLISAFSTPPDLAQRGVTGQALATQMLDRLRAIDADVAGLRAPSTYADNWSRDVALEIPQTGVSVGELDRTLRHWLGHQTPVSGELVRDGKGLTLTVRAGDLAGRSFAGSEAELPALMDRAAEAIQQQTQPYRYSTWLARGGRRNEADAVAREIVASGPASERPYGYMSLGNRASRADLDSAGALPFYREALRLAPDNANFALVLSRAEALAGHDEQALAHIRQGIRSLRRGGGGIAREYVPSHLAMAQVSEALLTGQVGEAGAILEPLRARRIAGALVPEATVRAALLSQSHQPSMALRVANRHFADVGEQLMKGERAAGDDFLRLAETQATALSELGDWTGVIALTDPRTALVPMTTPAALDRRAWTPAAQAALGRARGDLPDARVNLRPPRAYALARLGRFSEAQAEIATTPLDCYRCVRRRAQIAALQGDARAADHWFAEADRLAPSLPFADTEWGEVLLARGDPAGAVAKLAAAHAKSPRYADPLELWGEALMRQGRPEAAAAKFAEAAKYAPQWGRLHLMWGEALAGLGRAEEARARWRAAAAMDLSPDDRRRLAGWRMACNSGGGHLAPAGHTCRLELAKASPWGRG